MNAMAALNLMVEMGVFEKMPKEGSITAKELSTVVNLEASVIGELNSSASTLPG